MLLNTVLAPTIVPGPLPRRVLRRPASPPMMSLHRPVITRRGGACRHKRLARQIFRVFWLRCSLAPQLIRPGPRVACFRLPQPKACRFLAQSSKGAPKNMATQSDNNILTFFSKVKPNGKGQSASAAAVEESLPLPQIVDGQTVLAQTAPHDPGSQVPLSVTAETKLPPETTPTENSVQAGGGKFANVPPQASQPLPATLFLFMKMPETPSPAQQSQQGELGFFPNSCFAYSPTTVGQTRFGANRVCEGYSNRADSARGKPAESPARGASKGHL